MRRGEDGRFAIELAACDAVQASLGSLARSSSSDGPFSYASAPGYSAIFGVSLIFLVLSVPFMQRLETV